MSIKINTLPAKPGQKEINRKQGDLFVDKEREIEGVGMGVLSDGTAFLNQRGLARLCGVQNAHIGTISSEWNDETQKPRITAIKTLMEKHGDVPAEPHLACKNGQKTMFAYPDNVCIAILEYYAFEAGTNCKEEAKANFRLLAGRALREFIYTQVGYDPQQKIPIAWQQFHDRVSLSYDSVPNGYFSIFKEMADIIVTLIQGGAAVGPEFVPDISMGQHWGKHWCENGCEEKFGERVKYLHDYPQTFPQAASNPQTPWAYPDEALAEFRRWVRKVYIKVALPAYLESKVRQGVLAPTFKQLAIRALEDKGSGKMLIEG